ncbi:hypothetical protein ACR6C2_01500 [Streptomyces sp. INA 01156]
MDDRLAPARRTSTPSPARTPYSAANSPRSPVPLPTCPTSTADPRALPGAGPKRYRLATAASAEPPWLPVRSRPPVGHERRGRRRAPPRPLAQHAAAGSGGAGRVSTADRPDAGARQGRAGHALPGLPRPSGLAEAVAAVESVLSE